MNSSTRSDTDVIVIGARIAGAVLGAALGLKGYRVLVLDRVRFPSDTLSTHFFRDPTFRALEHIGMFQEIKILGPALTLIHNVVDGHEFDEPVKIGEEDSFYLCIRRVTMDEVLVNGLKQLDNVQVREAANVHEFLSEGITVTGVRWTEGTEILEATGRVVVGADGLRSTLASHVNPETERSQKPQRLMYYAYFADIAVPQQPAAEFHFQGNALGYVFPTSEGLTLVALSLPISEFNSFKKDPVRSFFSGIQAIPSLVGRFDSAHAASRVLGTGSIPSYQRVPYGPGWVLVGDAGQVMDPWSGQGIDQASGHAIMLSESLDAFLSGRASWESAMSQFHQRRNAFSLKAYQRTTANAPDLRPMTKAALARRGLA